MKIDKWSIMKLLQERGCISFGEHNYKEMSVTLEVGGFDSFSIQSKEDDLVVEVCDENEFEGFERISFLEYLKKSRELKIDHILGYI